MNPECLFFNGKNQYATKAVCIFLPQIHSIYCLFFRLNMYRSHSMTLLVLKTPSKHQLGECGTLNYQRVNSLSNESIKRKDPSLNLSTKLCCLQNQNQGKNYELQIKLYFFINCYLQTNAHWFHLKWIRYSKIKYNFKEQKLLSLDNSKTI